MTKKSIGYVHMVWTCPRCTTRNPGPHKFCNGCGAPQPPDVAFEQAPEERLLTDAEEIARAKAGPDIHCPYCQGRNPSTAKFCGACGGDLTTGQAREAGKVVGGFRSTPAAPIVCPQCGTSNPGSALRCAQCGASLSAAVEPASAVRKPEAARPARHLPIWLILGLVVLCGVAALVLLLQVGRTSETIGVVDSVRWERRVAIEALQWVNHENWQDEIPSDAQIDSCREEYRYTSEQPVSNSLEVCGTPYTVDTGSGYGEVVQDCVYEVYDTWCSYTAQEWTVVDTAVASGSSTALAWPSFSLSSYERQGDTSESYSVLFVTDDGEYTYTPDSAAEFAAFTPGSRWRLEIGGFGSITVIEPVR